MATCDCSCQSPTPLETSERPDDVNAEVLIDVRSEKNLCSHPTMLFLLFAYYQTVETTAPSAKSDGVDVEVRSNVLLCQQHTKPVVILTHKYVIPLFFHPEEPGADASF